MSQERSRHSARTGRRWHRLNRGDLAILLAGVMAFLAITFGGPLVNQPRPAAVGSGAPAVPSATISATLPATGGVAEEQGTTAAPSPLPEQQAPGPATPALVLPAAAEPVRIRYPSAGFDVPVHPLELDSATQASQTIVPPETKDGYWLTAFGKPGQDSTNTTYVIGHSWDGAEAPFNQLSSASRVGDRFEVDTASGTMAYQVENVTTYVKSSLKDSPIWDIVPNRLVLISCYTEDPWGKNVVITASPAVS